MRHALLLPLITIMATAYAIPANAQASGLVSCWSMDEAGGVRADSYGQNHLTDVNTVGFASGRQGVSALFSSDNEEVLSASGENVMDLHSYTYAYWVRYEPTTYPAYINNVHRYSYRTMAVLYETAILYVMYNHDGSEYHDIRYTSPPDYNQWVFVAAAYDVQSGNARLSLNGQTVVSGTLPAPSQSGSHIEIGNIFIGDNTGVRVDELSLWNEALTEAQINALYNDGAGIPCGVIAGNSNDGDEIPYAIDVIDLPSGKSGAIQYSITSGDMAIVTLLSILLTLIIYWIIRDHVQRVGVNNDPNK